MTLEELEQMTGLNYDECSFVTRMAMAMTCLKSMEEDKSESKL